MRKIFAYLVSLLTIAMAIALCVPGIIDNNKFSMEYTGGFEVLYKVTSKTDDVKDGKIAKTISDGMSKMLDINEKSDAVITVENGNYVRVNVTSGSQINTDEIRNLLENKELYEISFRDAENNLLASGDDILQSVGATYTGDVDYNGYPIIHLNIKDTTLLHDITSKIVSSTSGQKNLVIWVGFEEGVDSFADIQTNSETAKKVIYNATVSMALKEETISITGNYTEDMAKKTVNLINSGTYDYDLEVIHLESIKADNAISNRNLILIASGVMLVLTITALIVLFKLDGVHAVVPFLLTEAVTIFAFMKIAGIINPQVVGAFMLTLVVAFILYFLVLSKYKATLKVNKSPIKAYRETFKRNNPIIIDTYVTLIIFALVTYFLGNNAEQFAIYLAVNSIISALSLLAVERFIMFLTCDWFNKNEKVVIVSASKYAKATQENEDDEENAKEVIDIDDYAKHTSIGFAGLAVLGIIVSLILTLVIKAPFGFYGDAKEASRLEIVATDDLLVDENEVMEFFGKVEIELTEIELEAKNGKYHIIVESDSSFTAKEAEINKNLAELYGTNPETGYEYYSVYINDYTPVSALIGFASTMYTSSIALVVVAIYFALRYKYSYSLATVTSVLMTTISTLAFFAITRIPVNTQTIVALSIVNTISIIMLVPFFTKIKELMKEIKKPYLSYDERVACFTRGRDLIMMPTIFTTGLLSLLSLVTMFFDLANFSMYLAIIIGSAFALVYNMVIVPRVWLLFENRIDRRSRIFKTNTFAGSKYRTLDEDAFPGINQ